MSPPQVVVFDLGKVLVDFDYGIATKKIADNGRCAPEEVRALTDLLKQSEAKHGRSSAM